MLLFSANTISGFAQGITLISIPWYLISQRGQDDGNFLVAVLMASITFLTTFFALYSGT